MSNLSRDKSSTQMASRLLVVAIISLGVVLADREIVHTAIDISDKTPLEDRWNAPLAAVLRDSPNAAASLRSVLTDTRTLYNRAGCLGDCIARLAAAFRARFPEAFAELRGALRFLVQLGALDVNATTADEIAAHQYQYEVFHTLGGTPPLLGCTSAVACSEDGAMLHGRNLDWGLTDPYRDISFELAWNNATTRLPETMYTTSHFLWDWGTITAVRKGLSVSLNWRSGRVTLADVVACAETKPSSLSPIKSALREFFDHNTGFDQTVAEISQRPVCAPVYIIVGGAKPGQGVVLARGTEKDNALSRSRWANCSAAGAASDWFVVQANNDWWKPVPLADDRAGLASQTMAALGRKAATTVDGMWEVLSTPPNATTRGVLNEMTVTSSVLDPVVGIISRGRIRS